jgi:hypothetical protein
MDYAHWEIKGGLYQNLPINATEIPQLAYACDRTSFNADNSLYKTKFAQSRQFDRGASPTKYRLHQIPNSAAARSTAYFSEKMSP